MDISEDTSGLIYFPDFTVISEEATFPMICNPITGQYVTLPEVRRYIKYSSFLGFDPIDKQFKVLTDAYPFCSERPHHEILTLGTEKLRWSKNSHCPVYNHSNLCDTICINGILYYLVETFDQRLVIVCFDVRSEKFKLIEAECICLFDELRNYKGKLCGIGLRNNDTDSVELHMWVLEDVEKHKWSESFYTLPEHEFVVSSYLFIAGVTATGEIVLSMKYACKPFYVFYFSPERNTFQCVEIQLQGVKEDHGGYTGRRVYTVVDHVEYLNFISPSTSSRKDHQVKTSTSTREDNQVKTPSTSEDWCSAATRPSYVSEWLCLLDDDEFPGVNT